MTFKTPLTLLFILCSSVAMATDIQILDVKISGNEKTKEWVIIRELSVGAGVIDSATAVKEMTASRYRLRNLNLFHKVQLDLEVAEGGYILHVDLFEKWYLWPIPFLEFSDRNFNIWQDLNFEPGRTNYGVYLFNYNLFGRNHTLKLSLIDGYHRRLGLQYRIPMFSANSQWGMELETYYDSQNEVWHRTEQDQLQFVKRGNRDLIRQQFMDLKFNYRVEQNKNAFIKFGIQRTDIEQMVVDEPTFVPFLLNGKLNQHRIYFGAGAEVDFRDNRYLPMKGEYRFIELLTHRYLNDALTNVSLEAKWQNFDQLNGPWYSAFSAYGKFNSVKNLPYHDYRMLGYEETVRGFEDFVVEGRAAIRISSALRYHLYQSKRGIPLPKFFRFRQIPVNVYGSYFIDGGYVFNTQPEQQNQLPNSMLASTGFSLQTLFYNDRVLRFDVSFNNRSKSGFYIHFERAI